MLFTTAHVKLSMKVVAAPSQELPDDLNALLHGTGVGAAQRDCAAICDGWLKRICWHREVLPDLVFAAALDDSVCVMPIHATRQPLEVWFMVMTRCDMALPIYDDVGSKSRLQCECGCWLHGFQVTHGAYAPHDELLLAAEPACVFENVRHTGDGNEVSDMGSVLLVEGDVEWSVPVAQNPALSRTAPLTKAPLVSILPDSLWVAEYFSVGRG